MAFVSSTDRLFLDAVSRLAYCNPFSPERASYERDALGASYVEGEPFWSMPVDDPERPRANVWRIVARLEPLMAHLSKRLKSGERASDAELRLYEDGALQLLYQRYYPRFFAVAFGDQKPGSPRWNFYREFQLDWRSLFGIEGVQLPSKHETAHTFACFRQIQRAFEQIFRAIIGNSMPAARLRAAVWESVFTHDIRRYRRTLYEKMGEFTTLITGPSGSGKELVARAIGQSRYVPFDERRLAFADDDQVSFFPINIAALSPTLVESELFGHRRGAFTGAVADRKGWLETCTELGSVFLDELGDLDPAIQVKLLRVIETRTFHPVGETGGRHFHGKLIAATHRDLAKGIQDGRFREDLYYRLCSDQIVTPSLAGQVADCPQVLRELVVYMSRRIAGPEAETLSAEVLDWIGKYLPKDYAWPGNYRELDQLVKNVLIRRDYRPSRVQEPDGARFLDALEAGRLSAEEVLSRYSLLVYRQAGSYEEAARRLGIDRRTVKARVLAASALGKA
jgi:transcriptional regulator with AAA-type ATPase domain